MLRSKACTAQWDQKKRNKGDGTQRSKLYVSVFLCAHSHYSSPLLIIEAWSCSSSEGGFEEYSERKLLCSRGVGGVRGSYGIAVFQPAPHQTHRYPPLDYNKKAIINNTKQMNKNR